MPGPGQYYSYEKFSTLNVKKKDPKHQFFQSTEDRFKGSIFQVPEDSSGAPPSKIGPGAYDIRGTFEPSPFMPKKATPPRPTHIKRVFEVTNDKKEQPGPG